MHASLHAWKSALCCAALVWATAFGGALARAEVPAVSAAQWPAKPVTFIVPFPPGGTVDPIARLAGAKLEAALGKPFVIENRAGASGSIGTAAAAKAAADGYTFLFVFDNHAVNPALRSDLPFDTVKDFAPVMLIGTSPMAIATQVDKPYKNFADVIKAAQSSPESVTYGTIGSGSLANLTMTVLQRSGGFRLTHVPYSGGAPMVKDTLGGQVEIGIGSAAIMIPHFKAGKLRPLAVTSERRSAVLPEVPSLAEQGFAGFSALAWWGVFAPAGTPEPILDRMHDELAKAFALPDVKATLGEQLGIDLVVSSRPELTQWLGEQMDRWSKVIRENDIKPD